MLKLKVPEKAENYFISRATTDFSRRALLQGVSLLLSNFIAYLASPLIPYFVGGTVKNLIQVAYYQHRP
jgi:hypothetical protein